MSDTLNDVTGMNSQSSQVGPVDGMWTADDSQARKRRQEEKEAREKKNAATKAGFDRMKLMNARRKQQRAKQQRANQERMANNPIAARDRAGRETYAKRRAAAQAMGLTMAPLARRAY